MQIRDDVLLPDRLWTELLQWRAGYRCERCGRDRDEMRAAGESGRLTGHHRDHVHSNNRLNNGECLCPSCHQKHHRKHNPQKPCEPGCTCKRHLPAYNRIKPGDLCSEGHDDWIEVAGQHRCRTCRKAWFKRYYQTNTKYREAQLAKGRRRGEYPRK